MNKLLTALAVLLLFAACGKNNEKASADIKALDRSINNISEQQPAGTAGYTADSSKQQQPPEEREKKKESKQSQPVANPDWDKKIIKNATLNIEVKDYNTYYTSFREKVKNLGGYVAQEEQSTSDYKIENSLVIKVPVDQFDNAVLQLSANAEKVNERKISSQDVTTEFVDTKSRIEAKKQVRQRYMDLMNQARNMEEILNVQSEINGVQEEIEAATGRINYLGHSSAYSTINLTYYQVLNLSAKEDADHTPSLGSKIANAFKMGWGWVTELVVGLISIWPLLLAVLALVIFYKRAKLNRPKQVG